MFRARIGGQIPIHLGRLSTKLAGTWALFPGAHWQCSTTTPLGSLIGLSLIAGHFLEQALPGRVFPRSGARVDLVK